MQETFGKLISEKECEDEPAISRLLFLSDFKLR